jgi:hypothetical protein
MAQLGIDTPDYQIGVVSAQQVVGTGGGGVATVVDLSPNIETLVVAAGLTGGITKITCVGNDSGVSYPCIVPSQSSNTPGTPWFYFDVSAALDNSVTLQDNGGALGDWTAYADAGVRMVADFSRYVDTRGVQYAVPAIPDTAKGDHPPTELQYASTIVTGAGAWFAPAGAGKRYRVFSGGLLLTESSTFNAFLIDSISDQAFACASPLGVLPLPYIPQGLALTTNAGINVAIDGGAGGLTMSLTYTLETV